MPVRPAQIGFLVGRGVGGAVVLVLVAVGHFCIEIRIFRVERAGMKEQNG